MKTTAVLLAAGLGTRMRSQKPKVLHKLLGRPLVWYALEAVRQATNTKPVVVIGHGAREVERVVGEAARVVIQEQQLGTGHAVLQTLSVLRGQTDHVLVTNADMPLLKAETYQSLVVAQQRHSGPLTMLTVLAEDPRGFGRVIRGADGSVQAIVEESQATSEQLQINELNVGAYCFAADWLWDALPRLELSSKGEYYLTDLVGLAASQGLSVNAITLEDPQEAIGVNTRVHLAEAGSAMQQRINHRWMLEGVTLVDPRSIFIEPGVQIDQDVIIWPNTHVQGDTCVGSGSELGPNTVVRDCTLGKNVRVLSSVLEGAVVEDDVDIGPYAHLRKGAHLAQGVHMGNFGEVKNSYIGPGTKMGHFSYLGDAQVGANVNIGAGTITCNFDGKQKHPTHIGDEVFIGSDTMLVAPVTLGDGARTGAGSVVTKDVPPDTLVVGMPARAVRRLKSPNEQ
jgi:bifunctional UDP-N-acetylglucosamine pyrophosphorylase/glucosamine-1-phosphate N-acetyltransferase